MKPLPIEQAASRLNVSSRTLEGWIAEGAPVVRKGGKGRGRCTLVDPVAIRAWRRGELESSGDSVLVLAAEVPDILADAMHEAMTASTGPHKVQLAGSLAAAWYIATTALLDRLRNEASDVPELEHTPEKIRNLLRIFERSGTLGGEVDDDGEKDA